MVALLLEIHRLMLVDYIYSRWMTSTKVDGFKLLRQVNK